MGRRLTGFLVALGAATWMAGSLALPLGGGSLPSMGPSLPALQTLPADPLGAPLRLPPPLLQAPLTSLPSTPVGLAQRLPIPDSTGETAHVEVELDDGWRAVEREWLLLVDLDADAGELSGEPLIKRYAVEQRSLPALGKLLLRLRVPVELDSLEALEGLLSEPMRPRLGRHHIFAPQTVNDDHTPDPLAAPVNGPLCNGPVAIGMIDTAIELDHPGLVNGAIDVTQRHFGPEGFARPEAHGTAVAGRMFGRGTGFAPLFSEGRVVNASVFYGQDSLHQGAAMIHLLEALDWLAAEGIVVINMSLAGPDNAVLRQALEVLSDEGVSVVAAAGNYGPAAPPAYPAAYPGVIAVTAVDSTGQLYRWANRGRHIDFAAPGVRVPTTRVGGGFGPESGTSMAAPVVSAYLACALQAHSEDVEGAVSMLAAKAEDLGEPNHDADFGHGLLAPEPSTEWSRTPL